MLYTYWSNWMPLYRCKAQVCIHVGVDVCMCIMLVRRSIRACVHLYVCVFACVHLCVCVSVEQTFPNSILTTVLLNVCMGVFHVSSARSQYWPCLCYRRGCAWWPGSETRSRCSACLAFISGRLEFVMGFGRQLRPLSCYYSPTTLAAAAGVSRCKGLYSVDCHTQGRLVTHGAARLLQGLCDLLFVKGPHYGTKPIKGLCKESFAEISKASSFFLIGCCLMMLQNCLEQQGNGFQW